MKKRNLLLAWLPVPLFFFVVCFSAYAEVPLIPGTQENTSLNPLTYRNYSLDIPECTSNLIVSITNGEGELDLFMRKGEPFKATSYNDLLTQSDALSNTDGTADELIELNISTLTPIQPGRWYIAPTNWNEYATNFTLSTWLETGMPMPTELEFFPTYDPIEEPLADIAPVYAQPIGTGDIAWGGSTVSIQIGTCPCTEPVDLYFVVQISSIPDELYVLMSDGTLQPYSLVGLAPWKTRVTEAVYEALFGDLLLSELTPIPGTWYLYLVATPVGTFDDLYVWSTFFQVPGAPAPDNIKPYLDLVVDDTVIDFGRLDGKRRNLGIGPALGIIPTHPSPYVAPGVNLQNLCTYINGGTYLKTLAQLPVTDPNHINPDQYPDGMTCVFAVVADGDSDAFNFQHILPEPMFGRGNIYTAIPIPGGVPAGTMIDNYETLNAYNSMVSAYANSGLLSVQPHARSAGASGALALFTAPVEPLRNPPQEFPYVIAFSQGSNPVVAGQTLTESSNPTGPLDLQPSGTIFKVIVEEGSWGQGNAKGYIWMIPVTDDFWDLRHSNGTGDPGLWVNGQRVATLTYVGQTIPIIWEAPDDPDVEQSTHDRRHVNPDAIPAGGTVQLEARVQDSVNPQETAFAPVAFPVDDGGSIVIIDQNSGDSRCVVEWDNFKLDGAAMHFDAISNDLNADIELNFASGTITGAFSGTLETEYVPLWHQSYLQPFACEGSYSGQIVSGAIESYENDEGETHSRFTGNVNIHLDLKGGRTLKDDSSLYYVEGTENVNVVGEIKGSTESGSLRITWMQLINYTMPQGFYLTWSDLSSLFDQ